MKVPKDVPSNPRVCFRDQVGYEMGYKKGYADAIKKMKEDTETELKKPKS